MKDNETVTIMRSPCLPEDEGRHFFVKTCTRAEAERWIAEQAGEYFQPSDYYIVAQSAPQARVTVCVAKSKTQAEVDAIVTAVLDTIQGCARDRFTPSVQRLLEQILAISEPAAKAAVLSYLDEKETEN